jgi:hypothetical protein
VRESGTLAAEGGTLLNLGTALVRRGEVATGIRHLSDAVRMCRQTGDRQGEDTARQRLGAARRLADRAVSARP